MTIFALAVPVEETGGSKTAWARTALRIRIRAVVRILGMRCKNSITDEAAD